tara:strand:+ start:1065 stop:1769 length:705 start_codon:yes stop_codon:yes gene_type:complete
MSEPTFKVFLELQRRNDGFDSGQTNRIPLYATELNIQTAKSVFNAPIPFSGAIRGESTNLAFDVGIAQKTISITGVILNQTIKKQKSGSDSGEVSIEGVRMTAFEVAQLLCSYVDASSFQDDQNLNKLIILIPSRVDHNFVYHDGNDDHKTMDESELPMIPFTWKNRGFDNSFTNQGDNAAFFKKYDGSESVSVGINGFIRSFSCQFTGVEGNSVPFTMEFEEALVIADNFLDG